MFKKRRKDAGAAAAAAPATPPSQPLPHRRVGSASTTPRINARASPSPSSPFDFDIVAPPFAQEDLRPQTSDGTGQRKSSVSAEPPSLPPIPRVSSQKESTSLLELIGGDDRFAEANNGRLLGEQSAVDTRAGAERQTPPKSSPPLGAGRDIKSFSRPSPPQPAEDPDITSSPSNESTPVKMESSLFPTKTPAPLPPINTDLAMGRAWIDARDKPYGPPPTRPQIHSTNSSPDLRAAARLASAPTPGRSPLSATYGLPPPTRPGPQSSLSASNINHLIRPPSNAATNYSGTTARSNHSSKSTAIGSDLPTPTIGTPYGETSPSFPLPQHVMTRPKTAGTTATINGVDVPTHHTSSLSNRTEPPQVKPEKRKNKLLNPMSLLSRRRSGQDDETLAAQAQALQRQKNVAAVGVNKMPEDFDPRIRGKVVHDFSAPRQSRQMFTYNDALDPWGQMQGRERGLQSSNSAPFVHTLHGEEGTQRSEPESSARRSIHTAMFKEHLSEDGAQSSTSAAAIQAERLENKAFLDRASQISQESAVLPPFARRSQQIESSQLTYARDEPSLLTERLSGEKKDRERDPRLSTSSSGVSPITQRNSALPLAADVMQEGVSPISPSNSDRYGLSSLPRPMSRPVSEVSRLGSSDGPKSYRMSEVSKLGSTDGARPVSTLSSGSIARDEISSDTNSKHISGIEPIAEEQTPKIGDGVIPLPERAAPPIPTSLKDERFTSRSLAIPPRNSSAGASMTSFLSAPSTLSTPEAETADPLAASASPPNLVQKRADAVGHAKRASSGAKPRHHVSNASRFSFQFGGSAMEELALEQKARKLGIESAASSGAAGRDEEDDDYFDEDAMDDMDEMEFQAQRNGDDEGVEGAAASFPPLAFQNQAYHASDPSYLPMAQARRQLQLDDDDESDGVTEPNSDDEEPYWMHDDFRSYTHSRDPSTLDGSTIAGHRRVSSGGVQGLTLNTNVGPSGSGFYMHPQAAGYSPAAERITVPQKPALPHRQSGNSERNRVASGLSFGGDVHGAVPSTHQASGSKSTVGSEDGVTDRSFNMSSAAGSGSTEATGLGLSGFSGFKFTDTPDASRPTSLEVKRKFHSADRTRGDSETLPQDATYPAAAGAAQSDADRELLGHARHPYEEYDIDDMYFDDGGFAGDDVVGDRERGGERLDESSFDDDAFLNNTNRMQRYERWAPPNGDVGFKHTSLGGGDGPYPSFARPNSDRLRGRDSQLLLEDLPLMAPVDPKLIPHRNPSEDAKRLGLSKMVPPLPAQGLSAEAAAKVRDRMQAYHATLAEAAQKAFDEGRFTEGRLLTVPSPSVTRSESLYSKTDGESRLPRSVDDRSQYSRTEDDYDQPDASGVDGDHIAAKEDSVMQLEEADRYSPARMSFDFGFDVIPTDDFVMDDAFGNEEDDDDIVAAANAEALASDDDGFYGQEFGFYAKARPNSGEVLAINGGYFGPDGDDGLFRQRSVKEPNLTPITELSEFSRRTSFIGPGMGGSVGPPSTGAFSPFPPNGAFLPVSPWIENEVNHLRKLKASAFGGSNASFHSDASSGGGGGLQMNSAGSAPGSARSSTNALGYSGLVGNHPVTYAYSNDSSPASNSNPSSAHPHYNLQQLHDSPHSATSNPQLPFSAPDAADLTPKRPLLGGNDVVPMTARKVAADRRALAHSRTSSGADSVTYVREQDPDGQGPPRWVLERRRTIEPGQMELVTREVVQDGWI